MTITELRKVAVVGGGLMGRQIALNNALHGIDTMLTDLNPEVLTEVATWRDAYLISRIEKGRLTAVEVEEVKSHLVLSESLSETLTDADLVIEAIIEDVTIKEEFFTSINPLIRPDTIVVTNSSFLKSSLFAKKLSHPERLANLHYFNPALVMELVEVVQGEHTAEATVEFLIAFARSVGKKPIWVKKEIEGFIANRLLRVVMEEALFLYDGGYASLEEIDIAAEKGLNFPMGPFRLMDLTGVDLQYLTARRVYEETGNKGPGYELLVKKYENKEWGRKKGIGWYDYR